MVPKRQRKHSLLLPNPRDLRLMHTGKQALISWLVGGLAKPMEGFWQVLSESQQCISSDPYPCAV